MQVCRFKSCFRKFKCGIRMFRKLLMLLLCPLQVWRFRANMQFVVVIAFWHDYFAIVKFATSYYIFTAQNALSTLMNYRLKKKETLEVCVQFHSLGTLLCAVHCRFVDCNNSALRELYNALLCICKSVYCCMETGTRRILDRPYGFTWVAAVDLMS